MERRKIIQKEKKKTGRTIFGIILVVAFLAFIVINEYGDDISQKYNEMKEKRALEKVISDHEKITEEEKQEVEKEVEKEVEQPTQPIGNNGANISENEPLNVISAFGSNGVSSLMVLMVIFMGIIMMYKMFNFLGRIDD